MSINYFGSFDEKRLFELVLDALAEADKIAQQSPSGPAHMITYDSFAWALVRLGLAAEAPNMDLQQVLRALTVPQTHGREDDADTRRILGVLWMLIGQGAIYPRLRSREGGSHYVVRIDEIAITDRGRQLFQQGGNHPLHPKFLDDVRTAKVLDSVVVALEDAVACLRSSVLRPAIAMAGVAFEETVELAYDAEVAAGRIQPPTRPDNARDRIGKVNSTVDQRFTNKEPDKRHRAKMALTAAEVVRVERNNSAHPNTPIDDRVKVEGLIQQTASHIRQLWDLYQLPRQS